MLGGEVILPNGDTIATKVEPRDPELWIAWFHGGGSNKDNPRADAVNKLANSIGASFVALDARGGNGQSKTILQDLTLEHWIEDMEAVIEKVCGSAVSVLLMGHSRGGYVATCIASKRKHPNIKGVVAISAPFGRYAERDAELLVGLRGVPMLIIHGAQDETVNVEHAFNFYGRCGKDTTSLIVLGGVDHRFKGLEEEIVLFAEQFLRRVLRGAE